MKTSNITFIGGGNITRALVAGLVAMNYPPEKLIVAGRSLEKLRVLKQQLGIQVTDDKREAIESADVVLFAVKSSALLPICKELKGLFIEQRPLIISVAAGVTVSLLSNYLDPSLSIIRAMPNTPVAVSAGATAMFPNEKVSIEQKESVEGIFRSVGVVVWVNKESDMDLITAFSGSGPAYYFFMMEAMQEAVSAMGLDDKVIKLLGLQTVLGAVKMAMESQQDIKELRRSITSAQGITEAAIEVFEQGGFKQVISDALEAAVSRGQAISVKLEKQKSSLD